MVIAVSQLLLVINHEFLVDPLGAGEIKAGAVHLGKLPQRNGILINRQIVMASDLQDMLTNIGRSAIQIEVGMIG